MSTHTKRMGAWDKTLEAVVKQEPYFHGTADLEDRAAMWQTCAVGETLKHLGIQCVAKVIDEDRDLETLGNTFYERIKAQQYETAQKTHAEIKDHVAHRRNFLVAKYTP